MHNNLDTQTLQKRFNNVTFIDPSNTYVGDNVSIDCGSTIYPMVSLYGNTKIGANCTVFSFCDLTDTCLGEGSDIRSTYTTGAIIGANCTVGPFACLRKGTTIGDNCRVGDFVEVKNSALANGVKVAHLSYIGDSEVGSKTNVGCGTVFANYDGKIKQKITVGDNVFIGCNTNLIAPLDIGENSYIAGGSTITQAIPPNSFAKSRIPQVIRDRKPH